VPKKLVDIKLCFPIPPQGGSSALIRFVYDVLRAVFPSGSRLTNRVRCRSNILLFTPLPGEPPGGGPGCRLHVTGS
jgi:hypothetical protein